MAQILNPEHCTQAYPPAVRFERQGVFLTLRVRQRPLRQFVAVPVHDQPELVQPRLLHAGLGLGSGYTSGLKLM